VAVFAFDIPTRIVSVDASFTIQEGFDALRDFEDVPEMMAQLRMAVAGGKDQLSGGLQTIVTFTLLDGWRFQFPAQPGPALVEFVISEGNLVGLVGELGSANQTPVAPSAFVFPVYSQATTGGVVQTGDTSLERVDGQKVMRESAGPALPGFILIYSEDAVPVLIGHKEIWQDEAKTTGWVKRQDILLEGPLIAGPPP